jgi:uncharacterized protein (DUF58 family)
METSELLKKVRKIEIKTRGLSSQIFSGEYHSAFKGRGMAFSEVREYQPGDDIRSIDWNVTARLNHPYVKIFEEERELTVMLLVDISASGDFGTKVQFKKELITELCAVLSFSAIQNNDKIGVIFFSDQIEKFIPPKKGKSHILRIIRELIEFKPEHTKTDLGSALRYFTNVIKKRSIAFLISDFMDFGREKHFEDAMKIAAKKHDLVGLKIYDERETVLPEIGLVRIKDAETGKVKWIDTSDKNARAAYGGWWKGREKYLSDLFIRSGVQSVNLRTDQNYVQPLMNFFKSRGKR